MQKNYTISCCSECPAFIRKDFFCNKREWVIEQDISNPVDVTMLGFPDWCPLPDAEIVGDSLNGELRKIARQILKRLDLDLDNDSVNAIFHYLSTVVDVKGFKDAEAEGNDLFSVSVS